MSDISPAVRLSERFPKKRAFITGAASGLGRELAIALAAAGWVLGLLDIAAGELNATKNEAVSRGAGDVLTYHGDVSVEFFVTSSIADFWMGLGGIDLLVNNAGVAVAGLLEDTLTEDWEWIVNTNLLGVVWGCRAAVPRMRQAGSGIVLNIASAAAFAAAPRMAPYNVTKAGVVSLSETLAGELAGSGLQVSCAMPGFFRSNLLQTMRAPPRERAIAEELMETSGHDAAQAAKVILHGVAEQRLYIVWPPQYALLWRLKRLMPQWFLAQTELITAHRLDHGAASRG
jgi:NAD(P)-dependent dehydrogenase (short-subunit alcohol dehydrogenase family)